MLAALRSMRLVQGQIASRSARCLAVAPRLPCLAHSNLQRQHTCSLYNGSCDIKRSFGVCAAAAKDTVFRESNDSSSSSPDTRVRIAQLLGIRLPNYCSGCGVKLQQTDPDGPG